MVPLSQLDVSSPDSGACHQATQALTSDMSALITHLRIVALECRAAARVDLFEACALLNLHGEDAKHRFAETLVKCLGTAVNKPVTWFRPGVVEISFDEAWIMRCVASVRRDDQSSLDFLLRSRVAAHDRRYIGYLIARISEQFSLN